jgi:hypothetical protein
MHGIMQDVANFTQDKMIAGLWKGRMIQELCWYVSLPDSHRPSLSQQGPSWSWVSSTAEVFSGDYVHGDARIMATVEEILAEESLIGEASIALRCRLIPASFKPSPTYYEKPEVWGTVDELAGCKIMVLQDNKALPDDGTAVVNCHLLARRYRRSLPG